jgi:nicotinamide-nucleotide amidase
MNASVARHAEKVVKEAKARRLTLASVESCTAGSLGLLLADVPGATDVFHGGFIVYTKANKVAAIGVPEALIEAHTAVSREVAEAMAKGGIARSPADIAVAITGVAGPEPTRMETLSVRPRRGGLPKARCRMSSGISGSGHAENRTCRWRSRWTR